MKHAHLARDFAAQVGDAGPVAARGLGTQWDEGGALSPEARIVDVPAGIIDHQPSEMTVKVLAGTSCAELETELAAVGQRTALPSSDGTVGAALALGRNHLSALGRGRVRSALLGTTYVSDSGVLIRAGGSTVKNVTGYDLPRLLVGAHGTLGFFCDVTLRTNPLPQAQRWVRAYDANPFQVEAALYRPSAVLWDGVTTWVHLEGNADDVAQQLHEARQHGHFVQVDGPPALPAHRWSLAPVELRHLSTARVGSFVACVGLGVVHASIPQVTAPLEPALAALMGRVKVAFDPAGRLNPGRRPRGL